MSLWNCIDACGCNVGVTSANRRQCGKRGSERKRQNGNVEPFCPLEELFSP